MITVWFAVSAEGGLVGGGGGGELEGVMEGEEEGGGWEVGDDDLDLPPDLVSSVTVTSVYCVGALNLI